MDIVKRNKEKIETLHPEIRKLVSNCIDICNKELTGNAKVLITHGFRNFEEQNILYKKKPKVTNAKGGQSLHNYGLAIDFCLVIYDKEVSWNILKDYDYDAVADWLEVINIFGKHGFSSGRGYNDECHLEFNYNKKWNVFYKLYLEKKFIPNTKYLDLNYLHQIKK